MYSIIRARLCGRLNKEFIPTQTQLTTWALTVHVISASAALAECLRPARCALDVALPSVGPPRAKLLDRLVPRPRTSHGTHILSRSWAWTAYSSMASACLNFFLR